jgi:hypothetical protein
MVLCEVMGTLSAPVFAVLRAAANPLIAASTADVLPASPQTAPYTYGLRPLIPIEPRTIRTLSEPIPSLRRTLTPYDPYSPNQRTKRWRHHG